LLAKTLLVVALQCYRWWWQVQIIFGEINFSCGRIREPQWECRTFASEIKKDGPRGWRDEMGYLAMPTWPLGNANSPSLERQ